MTGAPSYLTATQKGALAEGIVANEMMLVSDGRLSPFTPVADDGGIDLLIYDKKTGKALPVQVKSRTTTLKRSPKVVHFEIRKATLQGGPSKVVLCVLLTANMRGIERAWIIPADSLPEIARDGDTTYVLRPSKDPASTDRYTQFRCKNTSDMVARLIHMLDPDP